MGARLCCTEELDAKRQPGDKPTSFEDSAFLQLVINKNKSMQQSHSSQVMLVDRSWYSKHGKGGISVAEIAIQGGSSGKIRVKN